MPLLDLSLVTATLENVITLRVRAGLIALNQPASVINALALSGTSSDQLSGDATVGLFLYHLTEDAHFKNLPPISADSPPVRFTPMGVNLFYQLTTHSALPGEPGVAMTHRLFGLAVKALRDYPSIDRDTTIDGTLVFPTELQGTDNRFRIVLQAIPPTDAQQFWTAGSQSVRPASYYQVSAVLLEPDKPSLYSGRVLRYGVHTFVSGAPRLDASRSTVTFRVPGETTDRTAEVQPAEAPINGQIIFYGSDLSGDQTTLLINSSRFTAPIEVSVEWGVSATEDRIFATVKSTAGDATIVPGMYSAMAKVTERIRQPDGSIRAFSQSSNEVPFLVTPALTTPTLATTAVADVNGIVVVQGRIFNDPAIDPENLKVLVGPGEIPREPTATLSAGHFEVVDGTTLVPPVALDDPTAPFVIRFRFPIAGLNSTDVVPLRIQINGAESAPRWVQVP